MAVVIPSFNSNDTCQITSRAGLKIAWSYLNMLSMSKQLVGARYSAMDAGDYWDPCDLPDDYSMPQLNQKAGGIEFFCIAPEQNWSGRETKDSLFKISTADKFSRYIQITQNKPNSRYYQIQFKKPYRFVHRPSGIFGNYVTVAYKKKLPFLLRPFAFLMNPEDRYDVFEIPGSSFTAIIRPKSKIAARSIPKYYGGFVDEVGW